MLDWLKRILNWLKGIFKKEKEPEFVFYINGVKYTSDNVEELNETLSQFAAYIRSTKEEDKDEKPNN